MPKKYRKRTLKSTKSSPKGIKKQSQNQLFGEKVIFRKPLFFLRKIILFEVAGVQKSMNN